MADDTQNKLTIINVDLNQTVKDGFKVQFNPTEYTFEDASKWQEQEGNRRRPELQYTGGERKRLTMELFFDTYELGQDVRELYTGKLAKLLVVTTDDQNNGKRPPLLELHWGKANSDTGFPFKCVIENIKQQFTFFNREGTPVRAKVNVTFKEYELPKDEMKREPRRSSFPTKTYTVREGDTLNSIAAELWKDPAKWRFIADANRIHNPRVLTAGQVLIVPAIE